MRIEAVLFASPRPVSRETLSSLIGGDCHLDQLIADIREELRARPYELVAVAGGFAYRTRPAYADVILASGVVATTTENLSPLEGLVVTVVGYFQPITRAAICDILGKPVSRDILSVLRRAGLIAAGPRSPQPGAPVTYVTTKPSWTVLASTAFATCPTSTGSKMPVFLAPCRSPTNCAARSASPTPNREPKPTKTGAMTRMKRLRPSRNKSRSWFVHWEH